jgi:hypothetical protein
MWDNPEFSLHQFLLVLIFVDTSNITLIFGLSSEAD